VKLYFSNGLCMRFNHACCVARQVEVARHVSRNVLQGVDLFQGTRYSNRNHG
jgi:hypothetical protein